MSRRLNLLPMLALLISASAVAFSGCAIMTKWRTSEAYIAPDQVAEVRELAVVAVWIHTKDGKLQKAYVKAWPGWLIGPAAPTAEVKGPELVR